MSSVLTMRGDAAPVFSSQMRNMKERVDLVTMEAMSRRTITVPGVIVGRSFDTPPRYMVKTKLGVFHDVTEENILL